MGASGMGGGGRKSPNVELNLVPFIDLLSTLICFLLITAAWQELNTMSSNVPPKATEEMPETPQEQTSTPKVNLILALLTDRIELAEDAQITTVAHIGGEPNVTQLIEVLRVWKLRYPDRRDVVLATDNNAKYKHLVLMMDTLIQQEFPDVGLNLN